VQGGDTAPHRSPWPVISRQPEVQFYLIFVAPPPGSPAAPPSLIRTSVVRFPPGRGRLGNLLHLCYTPHRKVRFFGLFLKLAPYCQSGYECYDKVFGSAVHVFFVDSDDHDLGGNTPDSEQALWLRDKLAVSTTPWNIVVFHHPPYTSGESHTPSANMAWPFKDWGADAVITGHVHNYERFSIDGLPYFVNGVGGHENNVAFEYPPGAASLLRDNGHFGGILITADESSITFNYITTDGTTDTPRDTVTLTEPTPTSVTLSAKGEAWTYFHPYDNTDSTHANTGNVNGHYYDQDFYTTWFTGNYSESTPNAWATRSVTGVGPMGYGELGTCRWSPRRAGTIGWHRTA